MALTTAYPTLSHLKISDAQQHTSSSLASKNHRLLPLPDMNEQ